MPRDACLYFPHIEVREPGWIRSYILFWDEVRTIVPDAVRKPYRLPELEVLHGEGLLVAENLKAYPTEVEAASQIMLNHWDAIERSFQFSSAHVRIAKDYDDYHFMHPDKMTLGLVKKFRSHLKENIPDVGRNFTYRNTSGWEITDPKMALAYMAILANEISQSSIADPVTNYPFLRVPNPGLLGNRHSDDENFEARLLEIVMENIIIDPTIDIRKIVAFKKNNQALFNKFRQELASMRSCLKVGCSRADLVTLFNRKIKPKLDTLRSSLTRNHLQWVGGGCIAIPSVPSSAAAVAELFGTSGSLALAATFGLVATGVLIGSHQSSRDAVRGEPMSYLASIEKRFALPLWER